MLNISVYLMILDLQKKFFKEIIFILNGKIKIWTFLINDFDKIENIVDHLIKLSRKIEITKSNLFNFFKNNFQLDPEHL